MRQRELAVAVEIARAFLTANEPLEVYRLALARVTPLVSASFASVFLRDSDDPDLLRLVCAQSWPQASARFLSRLRIRVGRGPTGRAVAGAAPIVVSDVFADPALREWWRPARELGFASMIALPLEVEGVVVGALSFYFQAPHGFDAEERELLSLIAAQLAATVEKAHLIEDLERANERLGAQNRELRRRIDEAEQARRLKTEFLANMSHEFRTPLTAILGYAHLLRGGRGGGLAAGPDDAIGKIEAAAHALLDLVTDLLELAQLKLGRARTEAADAEAVALAERAAARLDRPPDAVGFRLLTPDGRIPLRTDPDRVVRILENLLSNAFKFTMRGEVTLTVRRDGRAPRADGVAWVVEDMGIGIEPDELDTIFDEFRQADGSTTRLYGGTGLGLALSLRLARLLGGSITADSVPGRGSTFTLRLERDAPGATETP